MVTDVGGGPFRVRARLDAKLWGGRRLERFGFELSPGQAVGEAVISGGDSVVQDGPWSGQTLGETVAADPAAVLGDVVTRVGDPLGHPKFVAMTVLFTGFLSLAYLVLYTFLDLALGERER